MKKADLIIHPTRLRIIQSVSGGRRLTAQQIAEHLPDIPLATLYRHLNKLADGGVLTVVEERQVRAVTEKVYALVAQATNIGPEDYGHKSQDEHLHYFTTFVATLLGDFTRYLQSHELVDFEVDGVAYYRMPLYLSDEEFTRLAAALKALLLPALANQPTNGRRQRLLSLIVMPATENTGEPPFSGEPM